MPVLMALKATSLVYPAGNKLDQNYRKPFNPGTVISFTEVKKMLLIQ
ncbi:hypothetical protein JW960_02450 [candidate division KSB1 bacterium]|nr:hypothetical protein [candidate division KSB1 bacterium]